VSLKWPRKSRRESTVNGFRKQTSKFVVRVTFFLPESSECQSLKATQYFKSKCITVMHNLLDKVSPASREKESTSECVRDGQGGTGRGGQELGCSCRDGFPGWNPEAGLEGEPRAPGGTWLHPILPYCSWQEV